MNINRLLAKLVFDLPIFGFFLYQLNVEKSDNIPTCAVSPDTLYYNEEFLKSLKEEEALAVLLHEVVHSMFMHPCELDEALSSNKDRQIWTLALEMVTNAEVLKIIEAFSLPYKLPGQPFSPLKDKTPNTALSYVYDRDLANYDSITVYKKLIDEMPKNNTQPSPKIGIAGIWIPQPGMNPGQGNGTPPEQESNSPTNIDTIIPGQQVHRPNALKLQEIANAMKKRGYGSANLDRYIKEVTGNKVPWERILYNQVYQIIGAEDISYNSRNFRHPYWEEIIIPGLSDNMIDIIVAVDTSGSISSEELDSFCSAINGLYMYTDRIKIVSVDTKVQKEEEVARHELKSIKLKGGGGTNFTSFFNKYDGKAQIIIFFTDGYATYPENAPTRSTVFWVLTKDYQKPPFGKVVYIES